MKPDDLDHEESSQGFRSKTERIRAMIDAHIALEGNRPLQKLVEYLRLDHKVSKDLRIILAVLADALDASAVRDFHLVGKHRAGAPHDRREIANRGWQAATFVECEVAKGENVEAAVAAAIKEFGMSRTQIFEWRRRLHDLTDVSG